MAFYYTFNIIKNKSTIDFNNVKGIINIIKNNIKGSGEMNIDKIPEWILAMEQEDIAFVKNFVLNSGSLKEIAKVYDVSYPTVRLRLDKVIQKIQLYENQKQEPFSWFIKTLAVESKIDLETAKIIIEKYEESKGER